MKWVLAFITSICCSVSIYADDACDNAVDAADSMNVNHTKCDYTDKGLNGVLHKAFKKGSEGAVLETTTDEPTAEEKPLAGPVSNPARQPIRSSIASSLSVEVDQWPNVALARTQLLPKVMEKCGKGFTITGEHYRSLAMGRIELQLQFECDK